MFSFRQPRQESRERAMDVEVIAIIFIIFLILIYVGWRSTEVPDLIPVVAAPNGHLLYSLVDVITNSSAATTTGTGTGELGIYN